jgi:hypothetical protein
MSNVALRKATTMNRPHLLIAAAWLFQGAAWFLPTTTVLGGIIEPIAGWQAFIEASRLAWPNGGSNPWYEATLAILSVVTTLFFILGSPWVVLRGTHSFQRASAWAAATAFVVNSHWYVTYRDGWKSDLHIGYFLWWWSFIVLAIGLVDLARQSEAAKLLGSAHGQVALLPR